MQKVAQREKALSHSDPGQAFTIERGTALSGAALAASIAAVVPFLYGYPLHDHWDAWGKKILLVTMCVFVVFIYAAATTYNFWSYLRGIREIHRKFAPPDSKYRTGK